MNFWTFLDRNGGGIALLVIIALCFAFGTCGDGKGCRVGCGPGIHVVVESGDKVDAGAKP